MRLAFALVLVSLLAMPVLAADYDKTQTNQAYTLRLRVPSAAMAIAPLKDEILSRFSKNADAIKTDALSDMQALPQHFHPYDLETTWRVTFDSPTIISLSGYSFIDENGAHPNATFDSIIWDKHSSRAVALPELFDKDRIGQALGTIASYAKAQLIDYVTRQQGRPPSDTSMADEGIAANPGKLGHAALTHAKGERKANGIVLLYGAGEVWAHVLGDVKLAIPASVFRKYLTPDWAPIFK